MPGRSLRLIGIISTALIRARGFIPKAKLLAWVGKLIRNPLLIIGKMFMHHFRLNKILQLNTKVLSFYNIAREIPGK
jgi:hypothetical protein